MLNANVDALSHKMIADRLSSTILLDAKYDFRLKLIQFKLNLSLFLVRL